MEDLTAKNGVISTLATMHRLWVTGEADACFSQSPALSKEMVSSRILQDVHEGCGNVYCRTSDVSSLEACTAIFLHLVSMIKSFCERRM